MTCIITPALVVGAMKKEYNAERRVRRNEVEMSMSAGYYTPSDLREIIKLQNETCYFTGEKLNITNKNWEIDHLIPVSSGGSFWPGNLAVVTKDANQEKHWRSKKKYWEILEVRHGKNWVDERKAITSEIDKKRKKIHSTRVRELKSDLARIQSVLEREFDNHYINLSIDRDIISMEVDGVEINFPKGLPRKRKLFKSDNYFWGCTR